MSRLAVRLPDFSDQYDGRKQRAMVQQLEQQLARAKVDAVVGAYTVSGGHTTEQYDGVVLVDTTGGDITVTLPEISTLMVQEKYEVELVKIVAANTLTVVPSGTDTIVGDTSVVVTIQWTALNFRAAAGNWVII